MPFIYKSTKMPQHSDQDWSSTTADQTETDNSSGSDTFVLVDIPKLYRKVKAEIHWLLNCNSRDITYYASVTNESGVTVRRTHHVRRVRNNGSKHKMQILAAREWAREQDRRWRMRGSRGTKKVVGWYAVGQEERGVEWIDGVDDRDQKVMERAWRLRATRDGEMKQRAEAARERERQIEVRSRRGLEVDREVREPTVSRKGSEVARGLFSAYH